MPEIDEAINEAIEHAEHGSGLNSAVAILVAITATLMALCNIKDDNIVQLMEHDQAKAVDSWSYYQSKSTKQHFMEFGQEQTRLRLTTEPALSPDARQKIEQLASHYETEARRFNQEKTQIEKQARGYEEDYDRWNVHDDQFDAADAFFSIAIAMFGVTALTQKKWLLGVAFTLAALGAAFGLAGFMQWTWFHPQLLSRLLGT